MLIRFVIRTSSKAERLDEYLGISDLRKRCLRHVDRVFLTRAVAPLTEDEIKAIDEAGAQGPSFLTSLANTQARTLILGAVLAATLFTFCGGMSFFDRPPLSG